MTRLYTRKSAGGEPPQNCQFRFSTGHGWHQLSDKWCLRYSGTRGSLSGFTAISGSVTGGGGVISGSMTGGAITAGWSVILSDNCRASGSFGKRGGRLAVVVLLWALTPPPLRSSRGSRQESVGLMHYSIFVYH